MNPKSLKLLEFEKILARLAEFADFSGGQELALALLPTDDLRQAQEWQAETSEARRLLPDNPGLHLGGVFDVRPLLVQAERAAVLRPPDLLDIRSTLLRARALQRALVRQADSAPHLAGLCARLQPNDAIAASIIDDIGRCISERADVLDSASDALLRIRRELKSAHDRLLTTLQRLVANSTNQPYLQEAIVTQRQGRYVIPLRAEFKGRIPGLIHDQSGSGATLFIEPLATVDLNNAWRELQLAEEEEIERILGQLTALVAAQAPAIGRTVETLAQLDLILARARFAEDLLASEPELVPFRPQSLARPGDRKRGQEEHRPAADQPAIMHPGSTIDLKRARHPLLDPVSVVPIDVWIEETYYIVVVTGPNTGGKTVALKTVGLLALMAQAGMHIPADQGSRLSVFEGIYADIGDEQSIEQSLSTFSSHLTNIVDILEEADNRCLVLLDELGAGTDPEEGAALARSLLDHLLARGVTTFATTHYSELKVFAQATPGVKNASVEFDIQTLAPTYELSIGLPGRSNALAIARRLGLPEPIVAHAESLVRPEALESEQLLSEIKTARDAALQAQSEAEMRAHTVRSLENDLRLQLAHIEQARREVVNQAHTQAQAELDALRAELSGLRQQLNALGVPGAPGVADSTHRAFLAQAEAVVAARQQEHRPAPDEPPAESPAVAPEGPVGVGDRVWVSSLQASGEVVEIEGDDVQIMIGSFRMHVPLHTLELRAKAADLSARAGGSGRRETGSSSLPPSPGLELDLRGQRADDAIPILEKYLDDAYLAALPWVRIIHGKGTGALRRLVRDELRRHPLVAKAQSGDLNEGGDGVTIVKFVADRR